MELLIHYHLSFNDSRFINNKAYMDKDHDLHKNQEKKPCEIVEMKGVIK